MLYEIDSEEEFQQNDSKFEDVFNFVEELKQFTIDSQIKYIHFNRFLALLEKTGMINLPNDCRILLEISRTSNVEISSLFAWRISSLWIKKSNKRLIQLILPKQN